MKSRIPKVLHSLCGRSMLGHALAAAAELEPQRLVVVAGHGRDEVSAEAARVAPDAYVVVQERLAGTGHAVRMVTEALGVMPGIVVVTYADMPLLRAQTLAALVREHAAAGNAVTVLTARVPDPSGYGRIIRDDGGLLSEIVEEADVSAAQRAIGEINSGCYAFDGALLADAVKRVATSNAQGQEYLTDVVTILRADGHPAGTVLAADPAEIQGVNDRVQLAQVGRAYNARLLEAWMRAGVTIVDPAATWIDVDVTLAPDAEILPGTHLEGHTVIGSGARIGSYVELKNATVGEGSKVPHLTYVGDADIGEHSNIGAATVFVNYDGTAKHHSTVGDYVRIGSDTMLVAPVSIGDGAFTAAGSVITEDVPPGALGVARSRQHNSAGWVERRHPGSPSAAAAARARQAAESAQAGDEGAESAQAGDEGAESAQAGDEGAESAQADDEGAQGT